MANYELVFLFLFQVVEDQKPSIYLTLIDLTAKLLAYRCNPNGMHQGEVTLLGIRLAAGASDRVLAHPQQAISQLTVTVAFLNRIYRSLVRYNT